MDLNTEEDGHSVLEIIANCLVLLLILVITRLNKMHLKYQPETAKSARGPKDDTDSEDEDNKRGPRTQVIEHAEVMQFGPNNTVIINNYTLAKPQDKSAGGSKDGGGEDYRNADGGRLSGRAIDMLIAKKKSVGIIRGPGNLQGTGFLLKNHLVMTSYHLIKDIVSGDENEKCLNRQHTENKKISIQFDYQQAADAGSVQNYFYFTPDIQYYNHELDVAVLKLLQDSTNLPECFEHFSPFQRGMKAHMIGHPQGGILEVEANIEGFQISDELYKDAVAWSTAKYRENGYRGIQDSRKILFHCRFAHGTSGSPGCYTDPTKENAEVVWMLLEGYPGFYYKHLTPAEQIEVPKAYLIQQGITMEAIWRHMSKENRDLCLKIFGHRNEHFFPI
ncbi:uncharacterized protein LOC110454370 isoform X2 [Mizuhopecten yessoensis]|uniref:uncharacterized protein LOC110454370 isoform X2 n=1 Tax=Mizuhopecten yessoensis TaxID=6573 RepID=UPI000B458CD4|nr:uncharacterized protein LOC110454370 isoform X2 [Mizuhopecten yessoensis]